MVIGPKGEQMGTKKLADALTIANYAGLDLVLMNGTPGHAVGKHMVIHTGFHDHIAVVQNNGKITGNLNRPGNPPFAFLGAGIVPGDHDFAATVLLGQGNRILNGCAVILPKQGFCIGGNKGLHG